MIEATKQRLHELVDALPDSKIEDANRYLECLVGGNAFLQALRDAPVDDEAVTEEDLRDIERGRKAIAEGRVKSWEEVKRELGL